jgi:hypothetical protein
VKAIVQARQNEKEWRQLSGTSIPSGTIAYTDDPDLVNSLAGRPDYSVATNQWPHANYRSPVSSMQVPATRRDGMVFLGGRSIGKEERLICVTTNMVDYGDRWRDSLGEQRQTTIGWLDYTFDGLYVSRDWGGGGVTIRTASSDTLQILAGVPVPGDPTAIRVPFKINDQEYAVKLILHSKKGIGIVPPENPIGLVIERISGNIHNIYSTEAARKWNIKLRSPTTSPFLQSREYEGGAQ